MVLLVEVSLLITQGNCDLPVDQLTEILVHSYEVFEKFCLVPTNYFTANQIKFLKRKGFPCKLKWKEEINR
jgi:hypothetical protein